MQQVKRSWGLGLLWLVVAASVAGASTQRGDFEAPPSGGFNNLFFSHLVGPHEFNGIGPTSGFPDFEFVSPTHALFLVGTDHVTFNLAAGERVDYAEVWFKGYGAAAHFHLFGLDAGGNPLELLLASAPSGPFVRVDTSSLPFAQITEIRLSGLEGAFDDLLVNVVPEPASLALLLAVGTAVLRRK
ncbi:hypothetical protein RAS1_23070 [Phycisphaerae bacterium RAS1]|nr:hypothetical protein RAS1_23070 [Phycisphaerae bacterium RAS1]